MELLLNKANFVDSIFTLNLNEPSTSASSGNMEDKKIVMSVKKDTQQTPVEYYPFNPSFLPSSQLEQQREASIN